MTSGGTHWWPFVIDEEGISINSAYSSMLTCQYDKFAEIFTTFKPFIIREELHGHHHLIKYENVTVKRQLILHASLDFDFDVIPFENFVRVRNHRRSGHLQIVQLAFLLHKSELFEFLLLVILFKLVASLSWT